ncbi:MAG TPA: tetratricopeptide repeat protein [Bacteroidia bacterium]
MCCSVKKNLWWIFSSIFFCVNIPVVFSQKEDVASLKYNIDLAKSDSEKVTRLLTLCKYYIDNSLEEKALPWINEAIRLSDSVFSSPELVNLSQEQRRNIKRNKATALSYLGLYYADHAVYPKSLDFDFKALRLFEEIEFKVGVARCLGNIGIVYQYQGNLDKALDFYFKALKLAEESGYTQAIKNNLRNIGAAYRQKGEYQKALEYIFRTKKIDESLKDSLAIAYDLNDLGVVYRYLNELERASQYFNGALAIDEIVLDTSGLAIDLTNIGSLMITQKKYSEAEKNLKKALQLSRNIGDLEGVKENCNFLSELYKQTGQWKNSFLFYKSYVNIRDSIFNDENTRTQTRTEMNYEFEKKEAAQQAEQEKKDAIAAEDARRQKIILYSVIGFMVFILLFAVVIFRNLQENKKKNKIIQMQKDLVEVKQKGILDSIKYAKRIQQALLPSEKYIDKHLKRLLKINS